MSRLFRAAGAGLSGLLIAVALSGCAALSREDFTAAEA